MNDRQRLIACLTGQPVDRTPYLLFWNPWWTTWERWKREGLPREFRDMRDVRAHFGADLSWGYVPVDFGPCPFPDRQVLQENDETVLWIDSWGVKRRDFKTHQSMSEFLDFPVKSRADWERYRDQWLDPDDPRRLAGPWRELCAQWQAEDRPIQMGTFPDTGLYGTLRWLLGDEGCLLAFMDEPRLVHEIMDHMTDVYLAVYQQVVPEVRVDIIHMWEDMCGRQGPLISPRHWEEFLGPGYRRIRAFCDAHGIPLLSVDTDGQPERIIPPMMAFGVNFLFPMEVAAGCDVNDTVRRHPELGMLGGIDKRALAVGPEAIDREFARVRPAVESGRYVPDLDHLIPDDVSWANFCHYARGLKALTGKA